MNLSYKQQFPWGVPTLFKEKIITGLPSKEREEWEQKRLEVFWFDPPLAPKIHSIRLDTHNRWFSGRIIHHSYGVRTSKYDCFLVNKCISIQDIEISEVENPFSDSPYVYRKLIKKLDITLLGLFKVTIDGKALSKEKVDTLAKNDGFNSTHDFFRWFNKPFKGKIIHWTNFKY